VIWRVSDRTPSDGAERLYKFVTRRGRICDKGLDTIWRLVWFDPDENAAKAVAGVRSVDAMEEGELSLGNLSKVPG
jgi:hypothetical protein